MNKKLFFLFTILILLLYLPACSPSKKIATSSNTAPSPMVIREKPAINSSNNSSDTFLEDLLKTQPNYFDAILKNRKEWKVQIIYTQIDRKPNNQPVFKQYFFNGDPSTYFYPASIVKMPVAILALQKINELKIPGLNKNTAFITETAYTKQLETYNDPTTVDGCPTVAQYVKKIFLVSDNDAYNRLYEFVGPQYINSQLHKMGYANAEILHRLGVVMSPDENRHTNPIYFMDTSGQKLFNQPMLFNKINYSNRSDKVGNGYYSNGLLIKETMDFSTKNRLSLEDATNILKSVLFPNAVTAKQRFNLSEEDYIFVRKYMSQWPTESISPPYNYDTASYWPAYCKFLLLGSQQNAPSPKAIRIFNKVGDAYGFLTDVAYIVDFDKQIECMISASIYCNEDGILNDDKYEYEKIGLPFMKHLGQLIYNYELKRTKKTKPDLTVFKMLYDK